MRFDAVIGNPPYQTADSGHGTSAAPIYHLFFRQARALRPRGLALVIPSRWFTGGKGLSNFRLEMLNDLKITEIIDFPDATKIFPGVQIKGGICIIVRKEDGGTSTRFVSVSREEKETDWSFPQEARKLDVLVRFREGYSVLEKITAESSPKNSIGDFDSISKIVSSRKPFGIGTRIPPISEGSGRLLRLYAKGKVTSIRFSNLSRGSNLVDCWKVFVPRLSSGSDTFPHQIIGKAFVGEPGSVCTESYLVIGPLNSQTEAENLILYMKTRFFRFMCLQRKTSQDAPKSVYRYVPLLDFSKHWTDESLAEKYGLSKKELKAMASLVRAESTA